MWNNLLVFSGICLFSLNFLSSSKSMEFPSTKFNVQQTWKNQHSRADTTALRKLTRNATRLHVAPSKPHRKQIKNNENIIYSGKETKNFHNNFLIPREIRSRSKNYFTGEFINDGNLVGNYATKKAEHLAVTKNSFPLCISNHSREIITKMKKLKSDTPTKEMSSNNVTYVNSTHNTSHKSSQIPHLTEPTHVPVKNFLSQLPPNGCANNTCEINPVENSIGDRHLLNVSSRRRNVFDGNRKSDAKNFNNYDNQINENLMRTKRAVLKAHRRSDTTEKIHGSRFNISVTDYPINVNFRSYARLLNEYLDHSTDHTRLPSVTTSKPRIADLAASTVYLSGKSTKEPIKNYATDSKANEKKSSASSQLIKNQYPAKYVENHRYRTVIKNHKHSRTKRQADEKTLPTSTTLTRISRRVVTERIEINENKATSTEYYVSMETRKNTNVTIPFDAVNKSNNLKNKTATNIIKGDDKMKISSLNETTAKPLPLPSENLTWQNYTNVQNVNRSESEKLRRLASSCGASAANTTKKTIFILGLFALTNGPSERTAGQSEIAAASLAIEHINQMQILGCEYELKMLVNNTQEDPGVALNNFFYAMYKDQHQKKIKALLGSSNAEVTHALAKITLAWDIPTISFGYSSPQLSDNKKYPMFFRTVAPDSSHNQARIAFLHFFKWNAITTICQQQDLYSWGINDLSTKLEESNITQEKTISFSEQDFEAHLKLMPEQDSKIIVASFSNDVAPKFFCSVYDMGLYGGDYVWILPGTLENRWWNTNKYCAKQKLIKAVNGLILISSKKQLDEDEYAVSFVNEKEFQNLLPKTKSEFVREAYDAVWATALSLNLTLSSCNESIDCLNKSFHKSFQKQFVNNFQFIQFKGTSGPILFHGADRICITNFYQIQDGEIFPIAQYDPLTLKLNFNCSNCKDIIWPSGYIPVSKRTYELHIMNITPVAFYVINSFAVLGILVSLCFLVFNIYYREQKYIKLSSPYLNATTIMGCILVYLAVIFLGIDNSTMPPAFTFQTICTARVALLSTGCSLAFGSIFAKTYRVHQIFIKSNHGILKSKVLQDSRLVPIIGVFVLIDGVIIVIWTAIDPMELDFYNLTLEASVAHPEIIHQLQVEVCKSEYKNTWLFALGIYKAVFFILGLYMAWETRNVKIPSLNDSEYIGLTVYTVLVTTVLHFTLANVTSDRITLAYVTTTSLILFTTTSSMCLLFLPKINAIFRHKDSAHKKIVSSADLKIESNTIRFVKNDDQEPYYRVHIQNFAYRKYVAFLDREIQNLHYKVYIKKNDDPDLLARRATKIYDKLPNLRKYRREKSSSLCGGIPNLFMLTVFPVVIPRASWPYAEHLDRPITEEMSFSSETKLQSIRFEDSTLNQKNRDSEDEDQPKCDGSIPGSPLKRVFDHDEYQDTSSDVEEDHNHPSSVLKICKAIVHSPLSDEELKRLEQTPRIMITDTETQNEDNNEIDANQQLEI